jgi:hypothetical protein
VNSFICHTKEIPHIFDTGLHIKCKEYRSEFLECGLIAELYCVGALSGGALSELKVPCSNCS